MIRIGARTLQLAAGRARRLARAGEVVDDRLQCLMQASER